MAHRTNVRRHGSGVCKRQVTLTSPYAVPTIPCQWNSRRLSQKTFTAVSETSGSRRSPLWVPSRVHGPHLSQLVALCPSDSTCPIPVPKPLPPDQRRTEYVHVRFTPTELARLDALIAALNKRGDGDGTDVYRATWVRRLILRAVARAEKRGRGAVFGIGAGTEDRTRVSRANIWFLRLALLRPLTVGRRRCVWRASRCVSP